MLATEEQAKEMWCPAARVVWAKRRETGERGWVTTGEVAFNRAQIEFSAEEHVRGLCIGSRCMWWRWAEPPGPRLPAAPERDERGYCGAAGPVK